MSTKILKLSCNTSTATLQNPLNECLLTENFLDNLKLAGIISIFKKKYTLNKENNRQSSVLPSISKIFVKLRKKQINGYINKFLSPYF